MREREARKSKYRFNKMSCYRLNQDIMNVKCLLSLIHLFIN